MTGRRGDRRDPWKDFDGFLLALLYASVGIPCWETHR